MEAAGDAAATDSAGLGEQDGGRLEGHWGQGR